MTRIKAFLLHLGISAVVYIVLLCLVIFFWYPQPFFAADGGWQGIRIITGIDLILGPALTLIVFRPGKRGLKLDLSLIVALQLAALSWGVWTVYNQRTVLVVFADHAFYSLSSPEIADVGAGARRILREASTSPAYAFVRLPQVKKARLKLEIRATFSGRLFFMLGNLYEPVDQSNIPAILARGISMDTLINHSPENAKRLDAFLKKRGKKADDFAFLPLRCRYKNIVLALRRPDGKIAGALDIDTSRLLE
ncbi:MAG: hypothetical protein ACYDDO_01845 [Acidiferrobacterales bacterium]